jgi:hypothetical protein
VQVQYAASLGVAVAARVKRMKPSWPDAAFNRNPTLVKTWSLRHTLHAHLVSDRPLLKALNQPRYERFMVWMRSYDMAPGQANYCEDKMLAALAGGPRTRTQVHDAVPVLKSLDWTGWGADLKGLAFRGDVVLAPSGPGATKFALAEQWLGVMPAEEWSYEEAVDETLRRYLKAHAPATLRDFVYWTGIYARAGAAALSQLKGEIVPVQVEGLPGTRYVLSEDADALVAQQKVKGVRLLAKFDPLLMAHKDKQLYLSPKLHKTVFQKAGQVEASVLIDGKVTGIWRLARGSSKGVVSVQQFRKFRLRELGRLEKEAARLRRALGLKEISLDLDAHHV